MIHPNPLPPQLTIYKASAGSGKTFTLTKEYIKLLIEDDVNYRSILAVTFTNKATEEMKQRILGQLYGIWKRLPGSNGYLQLIMKETGFSEQIVVERCGKALGLLLHNYSYFRVETIDAFFQTVLRNLARELDLSANLNIGLNDYQVEQQATDELIDELGSGDRIIQWILDYIRENMDDGKSWNVIGKIKKFGENIFKDFYKEHSRTLSKLMNDEAFFTSFTGKMRKIQNNAKQHITDIANEFFDILDRHQLTVADFSNKERGVCSYFLKLKRGEFLDKDNVFNATAQNAIENPSKWVVKKQQTEGNPIYDLVLSTLMPFLESAEQQRAQEAKRYKSALLTIRHMNQLRLLNSIEEKVREINRLSNRFMLSDTQTLLAQMIKGSDTPFIYEKIGTQLEHIMIDEFQDTGTIQWENFKILLDECMSQGHTNNLLVGDVKQSIYRWRSGDWRLLNNIEQHVDSKYRLHCEPLNTNYRSERNVIEFNNDFFEQTIRTEYEVLKGKSCEAQDLQKAYSDVVQVIPAHKAANGLVEIKLLDPKDDYEQATFVQTAEVVERLIDAGASLGDIAILVRNNKTIQAICNYFALNKPEIPVVSDEAFRLDSSLIVNMLVNAMRVLVNPYDDMAKAFLVKAYYTRVLEKPLEGIPEKADELDDKLPIGFVDAIDRLTKMPMIDMLEEIYCIFELERIQSQNAYVCAFYDVLQGYMQDNVQDMEAFIEEWDVNLHEKTIQSPGTNGIRLITIHKSKGLEFNHVIAPFCDWNTERGDKQVWCTPKESPYNQLPVVPVDYSAKLMVESVYEADYYHEYLQNAVDNLNLLYVAFTRAKCNLFIFGKMDDKSSGRSRIIQDFIGSDSYTKGSLYVPPKATVPDDANVFSPNFSPIDVPISIFENQTNFKQSNQSQEFITAETELTEFRQSSYIHVGNVLHQLFSTITTYNDVPAALKRLEMAGLLYDAGNEVTPDRLSKMINERFQNQQVREWFSDKWDVFNECKILRYNPETNEVEERRPDRVMIAKDSVVVVDFKFGIPHREHQNQVASYMRLLSDMGYTDVQGYLWYVYSNQITEVKMQ